MIATRFATSTLLIVIAMVPVVAPAAPRAAKTEARSREGVEITSGSSAVEGCVLGDECWGSMRCAECKAAQASNAPSQESSFGAILAGLPMVGWIFDTSNFPPRWYCGTWSSALGWLHIVSDVVIWLSYLAIPLSLVYFARKHENAPFKSLFWLFSAFIVACGTSHLMEAVIFWWPAYGLAGVIKFVTACVSVVTVVALARAIPLALAYRSPEQFEELVRQRTKELDDARRHADLIVEASPSGILMIDTEGTIVMANSQIDQMFGYGKNELVGQPLTTLLPERFRAVHPAHRRRFFEDPQRRAMGEGRDLFGQRKDGTEFAVEVGLNPVRDGSKTFVLSAIVDITDRVNDRKRLEAYAAELKRSNEELEQFAYVASHDLQEPLRKVASCCQALAEDYSGDLDENGREWIRYAVDGAQRMRRLVADLLTYSRVGTRGKEPAPTDAQAACDEAIEALALTIEEAGAKVICHPLPMVMADDVQLGQLLQNLIGNAVKYHGADPPLIEIGAERVDDGSTHAKRGGWWQFYVKDNGIGIEPDYFDRIFVIFQRLHTREEYSGTGIGLAICKKIVERLGGELWVESLHGSGSTFYFTLPAAAYTTSRGDHRHERVREELSVATH